MFYKIISRVISINGFIVGVYFGAKRQVLFYTRDNTEIFL